MNKITWVRILIAFSVICAVVGTIFDFHTQLQKKLAEKNYQTLTEASEHYNIAFSDRVNGRMQILEVMANSIGVIPEMSKETVLKILQAPVGICGLQFVTITGSDGIGYDNLGNSINISHRKYFKQVMQGIPTISEPLKSVIDNMPVIVLAVPIKENDNIVGMLSGVYSIDAANKEFLDPSYRGGGYGFVLDKNGKVVFTSDHPDKLYMQDNIFGFFEQSSFKNYSLEKLKSDMAKNESGTFTYFHQGQKRFTSFAPTGINGWYTFSIASPSISNYEKGLTTSLTLQIVWKMLLVFGLILLLIILEEKQHSKSIMAANKKYQSLLDNMNGGMVIDTHSKNSDEMIITYVSLGFTKMTGYDMEDIQKKFDGKYIQLLFEEDRRTIFDLYVSQIADGKEYKISYRLCKKDGTIIWVADNGYVVKNDDGTVSNYSILTDITVKKQQEEELLLSHERFSIAIDASNGALFEVDLRNQVYTHFENSERVLGVGTDKLFEDTKTYSSLPANEFKEAIANYFFYPDDMEIVSAAFAQLPNTKTCSFDARMRRVDNQYIWCKIDLSLILDNSNLPLRVIGYIHDINDMKNQTELLEKKAQTDSLTELYNKVATISLSDEIFISYANNLHALILLDIDNFKGVNDTLGHLFGDAVLVDVSAKLKQLYRVDDVVGRVGGDEFVVLMKNVPDKSRVFKKAAEISGVFHQTFTGKNKNYKISCSMGIVFFETVGDTFASLFQKADLALYEAKKNGKDMFVVYDEKKAYQYSENKSTIVDDSQEIYKSINQQVFELLYGAKDFSENLHMAFALVGQQYHLSRAYVFENSSDNLHSSNIFEWCNSGITPQIDNLQNISLFCENESYLDCFDKKGLFYCSDTSMLPSYARSILEQLGVLSTLQMKVINNDVISSFIGFDDCKTHRVWTADEIATLSFLVRIIDVFVMKKKAESTLQKNLDSRLRILDHLPDYICVVNPETHLLEYANSKMKNLLPNTVRGAFCYRTLRGGQTEPCETCLVEQLKKGDLENFEIISEDKGVHLRVNATYINWSEDKRMVLFYGKEN